MTDTARSIPKSQFFIYFISEKLKELDEFFLLSDLGKIAGLTQDSLLEEAKNRSIEVWFKPPENTDVRMFPLRDLLLSEIKEELDYLAVVSGDAFGSYYDFATDEHVQISLGAPHSIDYLLLSFQDLRWHATGELCVFMEGVRKECIENATDNEIGYAEDIRYQHYNSVKHVNHVPQVFITCKKNSNELVGRMTLDEDRVERFDVDKLDLYVEKTKLLTLGYKKKLIDELEGFKASLLQFLGLEDMSFADFPEKLFYIYVITIRNIGRAPTGEKISRGMVKSELIVIGIEEKLADDIASLIINKKGSSGSGRGFKKIDGRTKEESFESLKIMGLFAAFKERNNVGGKLSAANITSYLTEHWDYADEAARKISPIVTGTNKSGSWKNYPLKTS